MKMHTYYKQHALRHGFFKKGYLLTLPLCFRPISSRHIDQTKFLAQYSIPPYHSSAAAALATFTHEDRHT